MRWRVARVDEQTDREVDQEGDHENLGRPEISEEPGVGKSREGEQEQDAGGGPHLAFVQHRHVIAGDCLAKTDDLAHAVLLFSRWTYLTPIL
jgi:hypothetical protein